MSAALALLLAAPAAAGLSSPFVPVSPPAASFEPAALPHAEAVDSADFGDLSGLRDSVGERRAGGWRDAGSSLLLYGEGGALVNELGLGEWREPRDGGFEALRRLRGGVSEDGRFAWHWQEVAAVRPDLGDARAMSLRVLAFLGPDGRILWSDESVAEPPSGDPVTLSRDGTTALVTERSRDGWGVVAFTTAGVKTPVVESAARLERVSLTRDGRYAAVLWGSEAGGLVFSVFDVFNRRRADLPSGTGAARSARLAEDGAVLSGSETVFRFR